MKRVIGYKEFTRDAFGFWGKTDTYLIFNLENIRPAYRPAKKREFDKIIDFDISFLQGLKKEWRDTSHIIAEPLETLIGKENNFISIP